MSLDHISYSQYNTYSSCPRSWYLGRLVAAEEKQTWYIPIGTAVHSMVEDYLTNHQVPKPSSSSADLYFYPLIERQLQIEPDTSKWLSSGPEHAPLRGGRALQHVKDCFERALEYLEDIEVWEVEFDASGSLPELEIPIKAFIDILGEHKKLGPVILDWKTGAKKPPSAFQLETYAALLAFRGQWGYMTGLWGMLAPEASPKTLRGQTVDLSTVRPEDVGRKYQGVYEDMKRKIYSVNPSKWQCQRCFMQDNCLYRAGETERALYYDKSETDGIPF